MGVKLNPRIAIAFAFGLLIVAGSFYLSQSKDAPMQIKSATEEKGFRSFINVQDLDNDGIPDWQNTLNISTIDLDKKTTSATMTKTAALAVELAGLSFMAGDEIENSQTSDLFSYITEDTLDTQYTRNDILIGNSDSLESLRTYGNRVAAITFENPVPANTQNEMIILNKAFSQNNAEVLRELDPVIDAYEGMVRDMLTTTVPPSMVREHLALTNVYEALLKDLHAFREVFSDALPAMTRLRRYQADTEALYLAISSLYLKLNQRGIKWSETDAASKLISIE